MSDQAMRRHAIQAFTTAVKAVDPFQCVDKALRITHSSLLPASSRVHMVVLGKAAVGMARAAEAVLGDRLHSGVVVAPELPSDAGSLRSVCYAAGTNNLPDQRSLEATRHVLDFVKAADEPSSVVLFLISGGGSAVLSLPQGCTLEEKLQTIKLLVSVGADITQLNSVRQRLSHVKGGGLLAAIHKATVVTLLISDIIGDPIDKIASAPTVPCHPVDISPILSSVHSRLPPAVAAQLSLTPPPPVYPPNSAHIIASNTIALAAARECLKELGFDAHVVSSALSGNATEVGRDLADMIKNPRKALEMLGITQASDQVALVFGGETTVCLAASPGLGGRNQEMALAAWISLVDQAAALPDFALICAGSDGQDGPTDATGAVFTRADLLSPPPLDPSSFLSRSDSHSFWSHLPHCHFKPGPTGTNVMDIDIILLKL